MHISCFITWAATLAWVDAKALGIQDGHYVLRGCKYSASNLCSSDEKSDDNLDT